MSAKKLGEPREGSEESKENSVGFSLTKIKQISFFFCYQQFLFFIFSHTT